MNTNLKLSKKLNNWFRKSNNYKIRLLLIMNYLKIKKKTPKQTKNSFKIKSNRISNKIKFIMI
jgi:hypothetical protein